MDFSKFKIIWMETRDYSCEGVVHNHKHIFFHYIYVINGTADLKIEKKELKMLPGNVYLIPPYTYHSFSWKGKEPFNTIEIKFSIEDSECEKELSQLPLCMDAKDFGAEEMFLSLYREFKEKRPLSNEIISLKFQLIMNSLERCSLMLNKNSEFESDNRKFPPEITEVLDYIGRNLENDISLDMLAQVAGFEKNYFSRKFKKVTGRTPMVFVQEARIKKAKELLRYSDFNISQIADMTGFKNIHYFSNVFLKSMGIRPFEYREKVSLSEFDV